MEPTKPVAGVTTGVPAPGNGSNGTPPQPHPQPAEKAPPPASRRRRLLVIWMRLFVLGLIAFATYTYFRHRQRTNQAAAQSQAARAIPRAVPVVTTAANSGDMPVYLRGLGNASAFNTVTIRARVEGQLMAIHFQEGQFVNKGDLLAEIDPRPFEVQLEQAQGQLARDQAQLKDAQVNLARFEALWQAQVIAKQQLDTQRAQVGQFEGTIEADKAAIDNAKLQLVYARITAPISGRAGLRQVDVGNMVRTSDPNGLLSIAQLQPIAVMFTIPADSLPAVLQKLRSGAKLRVEAWDRDERNKIATGTLLTVDNQIDPTTGTSRLKAVFDNRDNALFPNQFVNCRLLIDVKRNAVIIPAAAIQRGPQGPYVYIVKSDRTAAMQAITPGITEGNLVSIIRGLQPGQQVVTEGQDKLQEGSKVETRAPGANR